ncbi:MAG: hypothetical protein KAR19_10480 [Bacteroidales bacterium]|nr:hypothetical protein [Bacteroidales bacterium]
MSKSITIEYVLLGLVIALTGFEVIFRASLFLQIALLFLIVLYFISSKRRFSPEFLIIAIPFIIPLIFQGFKFELYELAIKNILGDLMDFLLCYLVLVIIKDRFHLTFINIIFFLAIFSLVFYPTQFLPSVQETIKNTLGSIITPLGTDHIPESHKSKTLVFFTYLFGQDSPGVIPRNCGAFWEPGMFAVFLNLALLMNLYIEKRAILSKKNLVFIIALITTLSTTGYIVLFLILLSRLSFQNSILKFLISLPIIVVFIYFAYLYIWNLDFIGGKVNSNIEARHYNRSSRFGAAVYHFERLSEFPLAGVVLKYGNEEQNVYYTERETTPNGLSLVFLIYGIPIGIYYFVLFYFGISKWLIYIDQKDIKVHVLFFIVSLLLAFSQDITGRLFYIMILFFPICFKNPYQNEHISY